jgi:2-C-methyl-D-erythritol 4-phosphate cytidylyltransferase
MKAFAIITAAGEGKRFKDKSKKSLPKQFLKINGHPVISYSLKAFQSSGKIDEIIITGNKKYFVTIDEICKKYKITKCKKIVEGGKSRFESVKNGFYSLKGKKGDIIIIHDAARPGINTGTIDKIIKSLQRFSSVIYGIKISDTLKKEERGYVSKTIEREGMWLIQTPQCFKYQILKNAYENVKGSKNITDESKLVERDGNKVKLIEGSKKNIKLTTTEDTDIIKKLI